MKTTEKASVGPWWWWRSIDLCFDKSFPTPASNVSLEVREYILLPWPKVFYTLLSLVILKRYQFPHWTLLSRPISLSIFHPTTWYIYHFQQNVCSVLSSSRLHGQTKWAHHQHRMYEIYRASKELRKQNSRRSFIWRYYSAKIFAGTYFWHVDTLSI